MTIQNQIFIKSFSQKQKKISNQDIQYTGLPFIIDGDSLEIGGKRFRLFGIDSPEFDQLCTKKGKQYSCGKESTIALKNLIKNKTINCTKQNVDSYQRILVICFLDQIEINRWMVINGYALAYQHYSDRYINDEIKARMLKVGIWSGSFEKPWKYRHKKHNTILLSR
ncbi:thermonuclease family protein [Liberibacter crescens]|nr:thermonuclease family protein [Liberibacter crescens]